nr:hypothetical protein [Tanacetum cinerariifolium]
MKCVGLLHDRITIPGRSERRRERRDHRVRRRIGTATQMMEEFEKKFHSKDSPRNHRHHRDILFFENLLKNDPSEAKSFEIDSLIKGPSYTVLIGDEDIDLNSPMNVDNFVPIPRVSEKPLDLILETFKTTITDPLFDFDFEFALNSNNPILDFQNKESDEFNKETIMEDMQINSIQRTAQIPPSYRKSSTDITIPNPIVPLTRFCYGIFGNYHLFETLGLKLFSYISYYLGLDFPKEYLMLVDENGISDPETSIVYLFSYL